MPSLETRRALSAATAKPRPPERRAPRKKAAELAVTAPDARSYVRLGNLRHSDLNVRKTDLDKGIEELAEDLFEHGVLQNLIVVDLGGGQAGVVGGGRRLRALEQLLGAERIDADYQVPVMYQPIEEARAASLSENLQREDMNPADEVLGYADVAAEHADAPGGPVAFCARRFGVTHAHVEGRLRVAKVAPRILDALRDRHIGIASAAAYASVPDHELQLGVYDAEERRHFGGHDPRSIRDSLNARTYPDTCPQAKYVGIDAYVQAGGRVERGLLFGQDDGDRLLDPGLLDRLAAIKAREEASARAAVDGFAGGLIVKGFVGYPDWPKTPEGYERSHYDPVAGEGAIAVYTLDNDGALVREKGCFKPLVAPEPPRAPAPAPRTPPTAATSAPAARSNPIDWQAQQHHEADALLLEAQLCERAARIALFAAHPELDALVRDRADLLIELEEGGDAIAYIPVRIPAASIADRREAAEAELAAQGEAANADQPSRGGG